MSPNAKIIERIKKLLELASSPNENEARRAMELAQLLMEKYSISYADTNQEEAKPNIITKPYINEFAFSKPGIFEHIPAMMAIIPPIFGVFGIVNLSGSLSRRVKGFQLVGFPSNIEIAAYALDSLIAQGILDAKREYKKFRTITFGQSFWSGFTQGLNQKFNPYYEIGKGLVVYDPVKQWMADNIKGTFALNYTDGIAKETGIKSGLRAEIRQGLNQSKNEGKLIG